MIMVFVAGLCIGKYRLMEKGLSPKWREAFHVNFL
jgi:hypothetical protein